jgi:fatty acid desaturase
MVATVTATPSAIAPAPLDEPDTATTATDDRQRARNIRVAVRASSRGVRERHPILRHQSAIGASILTMAVLGVLAGAVAYASGLAPWWVVLPVSAIFMSLAHEIEHDQIHRLYFTRNAAAQNVVFAVCWVLRPYTVSPWVRRPLHLLHHDASGTTRDIEERAITNGEPWRPARILMTIDPLAASALRLPRDSDVRRLIIRGTAKAWFPLTYLALAIWYGFLVLGAARFLIGGDFAATGAPAAIFGVLQLLVVVWIGPNVLRVACLHFMSSNMHYFGDVEEGNVVQQTQVLNPWWLVPAQLFCFNFGSTHGIHHFVPNDPFYVRQMTAKDAHRAMRANGVRFNDLGTFRRANRYHAASADAGASAG